jgi:hypothetical protein
VSTNSKEERGTGVIGRYNQGYSPAPGWVRDDPDLTSLHGDPEFEAIVEELRRRNEEEAEAATAAE